VVWSQVPYSEGPWSGPVIPAPPPNQTIPPPIPGGGTTSYTYGVQQGAYPWSYVGWSGAIAPFSSLVGGIGAAPNPATGTVSVYCWWPYATSLQLTRTSTDGIRTPVRGAYPITPATRTLVNYATNPSGISTSGYVPGTGSPTMSQITRVDSIGGFAIRATNASSGTSEVTVPQAIPGGLPVTVAVDLQFSARPTSCTITLAWNDALGGALTATAVALTADQINNSVGQFSRQVIQVTPPAAAATCSTLKVNAGGMPAAGKMDFDRWMMVQALTDGTYGDGDLLGGIWTGTSGLSTSIVSPVQVAVDGECPLDVAVSYTMYATLLTGGFATSQTITLASQDTTWLTHPASPSTPLACTPSQVPVLTHAIDQGVFGIIGREFPVVVSASVRTAPAGAFSLHAPTFTDRDALKALLRDGSPLLVRAPESYGYGLGMWISPGNVVEEPTGSYSYQEGRLLTFPWQQVDVPAGPNTMVA
jgi:hypothetical protein